MELTTEKAESESAISIGWVRPHPQFYPRYSNRNIQMQTKNIIYRENFFQKMKNEVDYQYAPVVEWTIRHNKF